MMGAITMLRGSSQKRIDVRIVIDAIAEMIEGDVLVGFQPQL